ncbi:MAG: SUMF1/EgtB/PvdO family nonheme iron enzyme [Phycisphaerae bacterium]|nr:SUMF1/EgtB/PvdO family nonheme iron enzyme [Phycisphaerae bacterium]
MAFCTCAVIPTRDLGHLRCRLRAAVLGTWLAFAMTVVSPAQGDPVEPADASILLSNSNCNYLSLGPQGPSSPYTNVSMFAIVRRFANSGSGSYVLSTGGPSCYRYAMGQSSSTRRLTFWLDSVTALDSGIPVEDNAWIAVAVAYDATAHRATFFHQRLTGPDGVTYQPSSYPLQTKTLTTAANPVTGGDEARIGHGSNAASTYMWDGGIAAPCLWHNYLVTATDFQGLLPGMSDVGRIPSDLGLPGDLQFWFAFSGRSVNQWADNAVAITDTSGRLLTATACKSSTGRYPVFDLAPWLPISFSAPRTSASRPVPRSWPFPYSAAFAIAHDNHSLLNREEYIRLLRWFNTDQTDPVHGAGLDMETTFSIWAFVGKGYRAGWGQENAFSYYEPLDRFSPVLKEKTADAAVIRQLIWDGLIDSLHGYGDFGSTSDYRPIFRPEYASAFIGDLTQHGLSLPPVWVNHGDGENTHNVGPATIQAGDNGGTTPAPEYHWHLTRQVGSGIWSWFAGNPSGLNSAYLFAVPDWSESRNPPCKPYTYDDGQRGYVFPRFAARILCRVADDGLAAVVPGTYATLTVSDAAMPGYAWSAADSVLIWSSSTHEVGHACLADAKHVGGVWTLTLGPQNQFRITQSAQNVHFYLIRCGYDSASCFWNMADYFDERILENLEARGALAIAYAHLEYYAYNPSMESYIGFTPARLAASYAGFRRLADRHHSGRIFVAGLSRMLRYSLVQNQVTYRLTQPRASIYRVTIDPTFTDGVLGVVSLTSEACMGLTFYKPTGLGLEVYLGDQPLDITQNPPDATGAASCTVNWIRLHSSLLQDDECPDDPDKTEPGACGCGVSEVDTDGDGTPDCVDECPADPAKVAPGRCGCDVSDVDTDADGTPDCVDECPADPAKVAPGRCGCGVSEVDTDGDGTPDCGVSEVDTDGDGTPDCVDECPADPAKTAPGQCGCNVPDVDTDADGTPDCADECPADPAKVAPGQCGCDVSDVDTDADGTPDCADECPADPAKVAPGRCGCDVSDVDTDADGTPDCADECPADPAKVAPGQCGCSVSDEDEDGDGVPDCLDACPNTYPWVSVDANGCPPTGIQDFELFVACFSGPVIPYREKCADWDLDVDGDVDQSDFGIFQLRFVPRRPPGVLSVAESDGFVGAGDQGGPFAPASKTYTLSNIGGRPISWTAEKTQAWVTLSRASGKLAAGVSDIVEIWFNAEASRLAAGSYSDTLTLTNATNARGNTARAVNLTVNVRVIPPGMVLVPAGEFNYQNGPPIYLATFFIDQYEVTNASYCEFLNNVDKTGAHYYPGMKIDQIGSKGSYSYTVKAGKANYPIQWVSYDDATAFAAWRSQTEGRAYRLPTEQEWEKAAGWDPEEQKLYRYGFHQDVINCLWCNYHPEGAGACVGGPTPVGYYNGTNGRNDAKSYYGCYDMSGNVLEWTESWYTVDQLRVIRGGSWEYAAMFCTVADRNNTSPAWRNITSGFRLVLPAE